jgi:hypothetical protein
MSSALPPNSDIVRYTWHVSNGPANSGLMHRSIEHFLCCAASFGKPRFTKALNQQLRVCLPAPSDPRGYCKGGIDLKQTSRRLTRLSVTSEMGESGRKAAVRYLMENSASENGEIRSFAASSSVRPGRKGRRREQCGVMRVVGGRWREGGDPAAHMASTTGSSGRTGMWRG